MFSAVGAKQTTGKENKIVHDAAPAAGQAGIGTLLGYSVGYAARRAGQKLLVGIGCVVAGAQVLQHYGYITINWKKVTGDSEMVLDQDGDKDVDLKVQAKILKVMKSNIPGQSGFVVGFITGLKKGGGR